MKTLPAYSPRHAVRTARRLRCVAGVCLFTWMIGGGAFAQTTDAKASPGPVPALQPIQGLLLTPNERRALDVARALAARSTALAPNGTPIDTGLPADILSEQPTEVLQSVANPLLAIDGVVVRQGKKSTLWLNGQPLYGAGPSSALRDKALSSGIARAVPGGFVVQGKPGQVWDTATGTHTDLLPPHAIQIRRPAARKP